MIELVGLKLRRIRAERGLSLRDVEEQTTRFAAESGNPAHQISGSWLARIEREEHELTATKLISLAAVYHLTYEEILGYQRLRNGSLVFAGSLNAPNNTTPIRAGVIDDEVRAMLPDLSESASLGDGTEFLPQPFDTTPTPYKRAVLGRNDGTLAPMIRAGSIVEIHTQKRAIEPRREWTHEFDRPIYMLLSRSGYQCGWCELDRISNWLTLIPHPLSGANAQRWKLNKEVEVVGRVVAVYMRLDSAPGHLDRR